MKYLLLAVLFSLSALAADTLQIKTFKKHQDFELAQWGRGIAVDKDLIITAAHVVDAIDGWEIAVEIKGNWEPAVVVAADEAYDLAVIRVKVQLEPVEILDMPKLMTVGSPGTNASVARVTTIEGMKTRVDGMTDLADPRMAGGLSGSPLLAEGKLIGIISASGQDKDGVYIVTVGPDLIRKIMEKVRK